MWEISKSEALLTIAVPTINRATSLEKVLRNLEEIITHESLADDVRVFISDNCSEDRTADVIRDFTIRCLFASARRADYRLTFDENVLRCFEATSTPYQYSHKLQHLRSAGSLATLSIFDLPLQRVMAGLFGGEPGNAPLEGRNAVFHTV